MAVVGSSNGTTADALLAIEALYESFQYYWPSDVDL